MVRVGAVMDASEANLEADGPARLLFPMAFDSKLGCFSMARCGVQHLRSQWAVVVETRGGWIDDPTRR